MKIKVFGPEIDPEAAGICLSKLVFEMKDHELVRLQVELDDGIIYNIQSHTIGGLHYLEVNAPDMRSLLIMPVGKKAIALLTTNRI